MLSCSQLINSYRYAYIEAVVCLNNLLIDSFRLVLFFTTHSWNYHHRLIFICHNKISKKTHQGHFSSSSSLTRWLDGYVYTGSGRQNWAPPMGHLQTYTHTHTIAHKYIYIYKLLHLNILKYYLKYKILLYCFV